MFQLHDQTRRSICRWLFLAICFFPTFSVIAWGVSVRLPGQHSALENQLSRNLGLQVRLENSARLTPSVQRFSGLKLHAQETESPIAELRELELAYDGSRWVGVVSQPEVHADQLHELWSLLQRWGEDRLSQATDAPILVILNDLTLRQHNTARTFSRVEAQFEMTATGPEAIVRFMLAGSQSDIPATIRIHRNRAALPPVTHLEFDTGGAQLPCELLLPMIGMPNSLGANSQFLGKVWSTQTSRGWQIESVAGYVTEVNLRNLVAQQFPHHLTGQARITIRDAKFNAGRLESIQGSLQAGPGQIGASLVVAAQQHLQFQQTTQEILPTILDYEQLAFRFQVEGDFLQIHGETGDALLQTTHFGSIYPASTPQQVLGLVRTLVPQSQFLVPATRETDWLTALLPVPSSSGNQELPPKATQLRIRD